MDASNAGPGKGTLKRVVVITAIVAAVAIAAAAVVWLAGGGPGSGRTGAGAGLAVDEQRSVPAAGAARISVEAVSEELRLEAGTSDAVEVRLHGRAGSRTEASVPRLSVERRGDTIEVRLERERTIGFHWSRLVLEVSLPKGWAGSLDVGTVSGDVVMPDLAVGPTTVSTVSGDATVAALRAPSASLRTTSGRLRAGAVEAARIELSSVSGDVSVGRLVGSARARSTSGDITLGLPREAGFRLDARAVSGRVSCAFPIALSGAETGGGRHAIAGTVGDGREELVITTTSGDITVGF